MTTADDREVRKLLLSLAESDHVANVKDPPSPHPFPARMPLPLAEHIVKKLVPKGSAIMDPMAGSGSTLVAARKLGMTAQGTDIDPLAVLLSRTVVATYQRAELDQLGKRVLQGAAKVLKRLDRTTIPTLLGSSDEGRAFFQYWFPSISQRQLYSLSLAIRQEREPHLRDLAWAAFSSLIISKATSVSYAIDIPRSRPHKDHDRDITPPFDMWQRRFDQLVKRLPFLDQEISAVQPTVELGDARYLRQGSACFDLAFTSPPYLNAIDYLRGHKFSLVWMGHDLSTLRHTRGTMIGCERGMWKPDGLPPAMEDHLMSTIDEDRDRAIRRRYLSDLRYTILEMRRVVRPGGLICLVLGPSILDDTAPDSPDIVRQLADSVDLKYVGGVLRPLKNARRSLPPPDMVSKKSELASRMSCEAIVVLRTRVVASVGKLSRKRLVC